MRAVAWMVAIGTLLTSAFFVVLSLTRWEWNRALFFAIVLLVAEVAIATALILRRLARLETRRGVDPATVEALRATRPPHPHRFRWLEETTQGLNVFITFLVASGIIVSGVAWLADRIAAGTATKAGEDRLARQLTEISYPSGGLLVDEITALAQQVPGADDAQIRRLLERRSPW